MGIYIHIPFCRSRCIYCDFFSTTLAESWQLAYVEALGQEIALRAEISERGTKVQCDTLYLGGGTPSQLTGQTLVRLFSIIEQRLILSDDCEVTIEANPDDVTPEWVALLKQTPVNRISMGVQSFDDEILHFLRRRHSAKQAKRAVELLHDGGFQNLNLDLIYGLPGQTQQQFENDVQEVLSLETSHLSAYALQFESGTPLFAMREKGLVTEADEELSLNCYERLMDLTAQAGMEHYEISNFAYPGFRSRHNSSYWTGSPYIGLGAGAHSYDGHNLRSYNCEDVRRYVEDIGKGILPVTTEHLSPDDLYNECVMLRLRTRDGLRLDAIESEFGTERVHYLLRMAESHLHWGKLQITADKTLCLTRRGLFVSDDIISDLMV